MRSAFSRHLAQVEFNTLVDELAGRKGTRPHAWAALAQKLADLTGRHWPGEKLPAATEQENKELLRVIDGALQPAYSGVRPKLHGADVAGHDFVLQGPAEHGVAGLVNLFGIESPGLTASLAIADEVVERLRL